MNWNQVENDWVRLRGRVGRRWGRLTEAELVDAAGRRIDMLGLLQARYGRTWLDAERELDDWAGKLTAPLRSMRRTPKRR